jgi:acyl-phosphate glycerol 3-phosphate acyltransferase
MNPYLLTALVFVAAYLLGGIPFGYLVARARGVDIFAQGSGNIGATNVGRVLGRRFGILVFILDFAKGALPVAAALQASALAEPTGGPVTAEVLGVAAGLAAFLGHLFPVYLRFRGGKGVATGAGVVAVLLPAEALGGLLVWVAVVCAVRYVSLASLAAAVTLCVLRLALAQPPLAPDNLPVTCFCFLVAGLVFVRHRANLGRLLHGTENRLLEGPAMQTATRIIHVLAVGLWFGTTIFFLVPGLSLFGSFEALGENTTSRPAWFPLPSVFERKDEHLSGPREQGTQAAGFAVEPLFLWYFLLQGACALLALGTAVGLSWSHPERLHRLRVLLLLLALLTVVAGVPLERKVSALREPRYQNTIAYLQNPTNEARDAALKARSEFGMWHGFSLLLNFGTIALVTAAMVLVAWLPERSASPPGAELTAKSLAETSAP